MFIRLESVGCCCLMIPHACVAAALSIAFVALSIGTTGTGVSVSSDGPRTSFTAQPARETLEFVYDDFSRVVHQVRVPGDASTNRIATLPGQLDYTQTDYARDGRANVTQQTVKLNASDNAVTTTIYDALSRAIQITGPQDSAGGRPDRVRAYDSRGNLLRERMRDAADVPKMTSVFGYDAAGRQSRQAVLANAASTVDAAGASVTTDRVTDLQYDEDGRLSLRRAYDNNASTARDTTTTYDTLGRVDRVTDPSGSFADDNYASNGRLSDRVINDGVSSRTFTYAYPDRRNLINAARSDSFMYATPGRLPAPARRTPTTAG